MRVTFLAALAASALAAPAVAQDELMTVERITPAMIEAAEYAFPAKTVACLKDALAELSEREDGGRFLVSEDAARGQIWLAHPQKMNDMQDVYVCTPSGRASTPGEIMDAILPPGLF